MLYACLISCGDDRHDHENHQSNNRKPASHDAGEDDYCTYSHQEGVKEKVTDQMNKWPQVCFINSKTAAGEG